MENNENFDVIVASSPDEETVILTADQLANNRMDEILRNVVATYDPENKQFSAFLSDKNSSETLTVDRIDELAKNPQTSLNNLLTINACIQTYINKDDLIGITFDAIEANVNTEFKCSYKKYPEQRNKTKAVENARAIVDDFFDQIDAKKIIRSAIPITFAEGNYIMCLRHKDENWIVDYYPLGVAEISDYTSNGRPIVLINIQKLKDALSKTMLKDKKRQPLFFNTQDEEVEANYPSEVYEAYKNNDTYAKLDVDMTGVLRIGNIGRKYGVSPFLRALKPALMLETFDTADRTNAKARNKKIIVQYLNEKILGSNCERNGYAQQLVAHNNLLSAWKQSTVVVTPPAYVKSIEYVEPKVEMTNIDTVRQYRNREMAALGISFMNSDGTQTVSTANISLGQLMKNIDKICEQLESVFKDWAMLVLRENNVDAEYCPDIKISASEMMSMDMKKALSGYLFSTLGCSYETAYKMIGVDIADERARREKENGNDYDSIFTPHSTAYTTSSGGNSNSGSGGNNTSDSEESKVGRPKGEATEKQAYDKARNDAKKAQQ